MRFILFCSSEFEFPVSEADSTFEFDEDDASHLDQLLFGDAHGSKAKKGPIL